MNAKVSKVLYEKKSKLYLLITAGRVESTDLPMVHKRRDEDPPFAGYLHPSLNSWLVGSASAIVLASCSCPLT